MRKVKWGKKHVKMSAGQDQSSEYIFEKEGSFDDNIRRKDFIKFAQTAGILEKSVEKMIDKIVKLKDKYVAMCHNSYLPDSMKVFLETLITERIAVLAGLSQN